MNGIAKKVLTIAGSDSSGGAGIQADLKTFLAHGVYGMSIITAITAQNTTGVFGIQEVTADMVRKQMDAVFTDIQPDAVKIGMVGGTDVIKVIAEGLEKFKAHNVVLDPVMISTSGHTLLQKAAEDSLVTYLLPKAHMITPNLPEAEALSGIRIRGREDIQKAAACISNMTPAAILIKGGHREDSAEDYLYIDGKELWFSAPKIQNVNTHGTGCTLSSAIASNLAGGMGIGEAVNCAKNFITASLKEAMPLGKGSLLLNHGVFLEKK